MSTSQSQIIAILNTGNIWMNRIAAPVHITFGTFGNVFNIIIFTRPTLRTNPCVMYFLAGSIDNLCVIYTSFLARFLASGWNIDASIWNNVLCKLRYFFSYPTVDLVLWFIVLASIDRYLSGSENVRFRQLSNLSTARKTIIAIVIFMFLIHIHIFFFYYVTPYGCDFSSVDYALFFGFFYVLFGSFIPIVLMAIFGTMTIRNVYKIRRRVGPQGDNVRNERLRSNDRQLLVMLSFQLLICIMITAPFGIMNMYLVTVTYVLGYKRPANDLAISNFLYNFVRVLYYFNPVVGFYIYTLTGSKFRAEFKYCIRQGLKFVLTTTTGLMRYLPIRLQQAMLSQDEIGANNRSRTRPRGANTVQRP